MTLGERIKYIRKTLDLTQQKFAGRIGTTQNVLANYEIGRRNPSASAFNNICKTFNVSEKWLQTGEGDPFNPTTETGLDKLKQEFNLGELEMQIISEFVMLNDKERSGVLEYAKRLAQNRLFQKKTEPEPPAAPQADPHSEIAELRRQMQEILRQNKELKNEIEAIKQEDELQNPWNDSDAG